MSDKILFGHVKLNLKILEGHIGMGLFSFLNSVHFAIYTNPLLPDKEQDFLVFHQVKIIKQ